MKIKRFFQYSELDLVHRNTKANTKWATFDAAGNLLGGLPEDEELEIASEFDRTWEADGTMEPWQYGSNVVL